MLESDPFSESDQSGRLCDRSKERKPSLSIVSSSVAMTYPKSYLGTRISRITDSCNYSPPTGYTTVNPSAILVPKDGDRLHSKHETPMLNSLPPKKRRNCIEDGHERYQNPDQAYRSLEEVINQINGMGENDFVTRRSPVKRATQLYHCGMALARSKY